MATTNIEGCDKPASSHNGTYETCKMCQITGLETIVERMGHELIARGIETSDLKAILEGDCSKK